MSTPKTDTYPEDGFDGDGLGNLPDDFFADDADDADVQFALDFRNLAGQPINNLITTIEDLTEQGRVDQLRATRFGSGNEALKWLVRRGIFLFSKVVRFQDGTWGVSIGETPTIDEDELEDDSLIF